MVQLLELNALCTNLHSYRAVVPYTGTQSALHSHSHTDGGAAMQLTLHNVRFSVLPEETLT